MQYATGKDKCDPSRDRFDSKCLFHDRYFYAKEVLTLKVSLAECVCNDTVTVESGSS